MQPDSPSNRRKPRWHYFFFVLAAFDIATVGFSLFLNHGVLGIHSHSVEVGKAWAERLNRLSELRALAGAANAPGNEVFISHNIPAERASLRAAAAEFESALVAIEEELVPALGFPDSGHIRSDVARIRGTMANMVAETENIFALVAAGKTEQAGARMAVMDRHYAHIAMIVGMMSELIEDAQSHLYAQELQTAARLRRAEYLIALAIFIMVLAACFYGHRASRSLNRSAAERERFVVELQSARAELESRVTARTAELAREVAEHQRAADELLRTQAQLVDSSRQAGMAEVATGVLHNVGNVLNSVNVSADLALDRVRGSKAPSLARVVQLLREHEADLAEFLSRDPKGRQVPAFLAAISEQLATEREFLTAELRGLQQNVEHIKQIVSTQQSFAKLSGTREILRVQELVEDALRIHALALKRHGIDVAREFEPVPNITTDRHKVLQILVNLVSNAKQALDARAQGRHLTLRVRPSAAGGVRLEITDNGMGIAPENLTRIFSHGFTTKKDGHGFGLHSGANAARELGGSLSVHSDGPGLGATFVLELPVNTAAGVEPFPKAEPRAA